MLTSEQRDAVVAEAARAPSVHNVQPARWRFDADGVVLLRAPGRELPVGDPSGHDLAASLGAAWEGMAIALSRTGCVLGAPVAVGASRGQGAGEADGARTDGEDVARAISVTGEAGDRARLPGGGAPPQPVARALITTGITGPTAADPLAPWVHARRSFRGRFAPPTDLARTRLLALAAPDTVVVDDAGDIRDIAAMHDRATWHFEANPAYHAELWSWLRLSPSHPAWSRDGLNADCLALSHVERAGARVALRPGVFALLSRLGIARHLVSEAPQVRSATGIVLFAPRRDLAPFDVGRRFYRLWLELTAAGLHAAPMSATSDFDETRTALERRHAIPSDRRLANVLRVGIAADVAESPRLPLHELRA